MADHESAQVFTLATVLLVALTSSVTLAQEPGEHRADIQVTLQMEGSDHAIRDGAAFQVVEEPEVPPSRPVLPSSEDLIHANEQGVLRIPRPSERQQWICVADGCAWENVTLSAETPESITVDLQEGGGADIMVLGWKALDDPRLYLGWLGGLGSTSFTKAAPAFRIPLPVDTKTVSLRGLSCGQYEIVLRRGSGEASGPVYGRTVLNVTPGAIDSAKLSVGRLVREGRGRVICEVLVPEEYDQVPRWATVTGIKRNGWGVERDVQMRRTTDPRCFSLATRRLSYGRYRVRIEAIQYEFEVTLDQQSVVEQVELPIPAKVCCRVKDHETGNVLPAAEVTWFAFAPREKVSGGGLESAKKGLIQGDYYLHPPPGRVWVTGSAPGYVAHERRIYVEAGDEIHLSFALKRGGAIRVQIHVDGQKATAIEASVVLSSPVHLWPIARVVRIPNSFHWFSGGSTDWDGLAPGSYEVHLGTVPGFKPVSNRIVTLGRGDVVTLDYHLERE